MVEFAQSVAKAITLMNEALALLDRDGETVAASHLQHAIDAARRTQALSSIAEADTFLASPEGQALHNRLASQSPGSTGDERQR